MSSVYNPLSSSAFLNEFSGGSGSLSGSNEILGESAPGPLLIPAAPSSAPSSGYGSIPDLLTGGAGSAAKQMFGAGVLGGQGLEITRLVSLVLGLLIIVAGLFMFRPVQEGFREGVKTAAV